MAVKGRGGCSKRLSPGSTGRTDVDAGDAARELRCALCGRGLRRRHQQCAAARCWVLCVHGSAPLKPAGSSAAGAA